MQQEAAGAAAFNQKPGFCFVFFGQLQKRDAMLMCSVFENIRK